MPNPKFSLIGHIAFLRQTASELRDTALHGPELAAALRHMADQVDAEADDLSEATGLIGVGFV